MNELTAPPKKNDKKPVVLADPGKIDAALAACGYPVEKTEHGWIVHGEAQDVLEKMVEYEAEVDGICIDPPWMPVGTAYPASSVSASKDKSKRSGKQWSDYLTLKMAFSGVFRLMREVQSEHGATMIFCGTVPSAMFVQLALPLWTRQCICVWHKRKGRVWLPFTCLPEYILFCVSDPFYKPDDVEVNYAVFEHAPVPVAERIHDAEKPVELLRDLVRLTTPPGGVVLDCFAGSVSTMRAARNIGRKCLAIEADDEFFARAADKARKEGIQKPLFGG